MSARNFVGRVTLVLAPVSVGAAVYWLAVGYYTAAFWGMVCVVLMMEARVRTGLRLPRERNFMLHVAAGALLLAALGALALWPTLLWMPYIAAVLLVMVAAGGGVLLVRQCVALQ